MSLVSVSSNYIVVLFTDRNYSTFDEVYQALLNREVKGMLLDAYEAGARKDQISHKDIRVVKVYDYSSTYGVVLARNSTKLLKCSYGYMQANKAKMFELIAQHIESIEVERN